MFEAEIVQMSKKKTMQMKRTEMTKTEMTERKRQRNAETTVTEITETEIIERRKAMGGIEMLGYSSITGRFSDLATDTTSMHRKVCKQPQTSLMRRRIWPESRLPLVRHLLAELLRNKHPATLGPLPRGNQSVPFEPMVFQYGSAVSTFFSGTRTGRGPACLSGCQCFAEPEALLCVRGPEP
ncbi:hypothetical protein CHS0354_001159 [Potamilus streckersoni]|uniref:Uncharacterized protein n=1 Tax=Potamilus streckersoni TaxID=2493646 RepID=A0AAE0S7D0_9BIVA|nr:hypothetical protein CHS0354_001159 [Potamilus streckersoni]